MTKINDLSNKVYGLWTVIADSPIINNGKTYWMCRCTCGVERLVRGQNLANGTSTGCGHNTKKGGALLNLIGMKIHHLTITDMYRKDDITYCVCRCDCGNEKTIRQNNLMSPSSRQRWCGCKGKNYA